MSGVEELDPDADHTIDIEVDDYYTFKKVIGHTYPNTRTIHTNTKYFDSTDITPGNHHRKQSGSNFLHEYFHKIGFDHDFRATSRRPSSLCYQGNRVYEECWDVLVAPELKRVDSTRSYRKWFKTYTTTITELKEL